MKDARRVRMTPIWVVATLVPLFVPDYGLAQLRSVEQTVFGMDCSPCAYALEKRIKRMDGVRSVSVSLTEGLARIEFASGHDITLEEVRSAVTESGFSPEVAAVQIQGMLETLDDRWFLIAGGERFVLADPPLGGRADSVLVITGRVPKEKVSGSDAWLLNVGGEF